MTKYRLKVWTGPSYAVETGRWVRRAGLKVPVTGTEHICVDVEGTSCAAANHNMRAMLYRKYRTDRGLRASSCTRRPRKKR